MVIIPQPDLFSWDQVDASSEMDRLRWVLDAIPDDPLICALEAARKGRRDTDADWGTKTYRGVCQNGTVWEKIKRWFGYKLHLIVEADYELPVAYEVTKASASDCPASLPMVEQLDQDHPGLLDVSDLFAGDKGYDSKDNNRELWDIYHIKPIIDIRDTWKYEPHLPRRGQRHRVYPTRPV